MAALFAYGTLMAPQLFELIAGIAMESQPARLQGFRRYAFDGERFPGIISSSDSDHVIGLVIANISDKVWQRLDDYESDMYSRKVVNITKQDGDSDTAETYVVKPAYHHLLADQDWDFEHFLQFDLNRYLLRFGDNNF